MKLSWLQVQHFSCNLLPLLLNGVLYLLTWKEIKKDLGMVH